MKKRIKNLGWFIAKNGTIAFIVSEPFTVDNKGKMHKVKTKKK